ncbi:MAG: twin-arginine translocase subunit TatC [Bacteroidetes bacterium]|nr:twin-arginine translocase subunit TatC [Bacteroidota bacterium]
MATPQQSNMTFFEHLEEMRGHLFRSAIVVLVVSVVLIFFKEFIFDTLLFGPLNTNFISYQLLCMLAPEFCIKEIPFELMNTELAGQFFIHLKAAFILGFIFSVPYIFWEIWKFISPALLPRAKCLMRENCSERALSSFLSASFSPIIW